MKGCNSSLVAHIVLPALDAKDPEASVNDRADPVLKAASALRHLTIGHAHQVIVHDESKWNQAEEQCRFHDDSGANGCSSPEQEQADDKRTSLLVLFFTLLHVCSTLEVQKDCDK